MRPCRGITSPISRGRLTRALLPLLLWRRGQGRGEVALKSEGRSPRAEGRGPKEGRVPKSEDRNPRSRAIRASAFGFAPRGYNQDAPTGAFRTQPFRVPTDTAARLDARVLLPLLRWRRGLGRGGPGCFSRLPSRDIFQRGPPAAHLAGQPSGLATAVSSAIIFQTPASGFAGGC